MASVILVYVQYGSSAGLLAAVLVGGLSLIGFILWLNFFPRTRIGRRLMLKARQPADLTAAAHQAMIGASGEALTLCALRYGANQRETR